MKMDNTLSVIRQKIEDLPNVVMYSMNQHGFKLPSDIINFVSLDEDGQLWFISYFPAQLLAQCDNVFPVRLHFFKRGNDAFMEISGKATIMSNISQPDLFAPEDAETKKSVLIKMTMNNVEYTEPLVKAGKSKLRLMMEQSYRWIVRQFAFHNHHNSSFGGSH